MSLPGRATPPDRSLVQLAVEQDGDLKRGADRFALHDVSSLGPRHVFSQGGNEVKSTRPTSDPYDGLRLDRVLALRIPSLGPL